MSECKALVEWIEAMSSDHDHRFILVVDDLRKGRQPSEAWARPNPV